MNTKAFYSRELADHMTHKAHMLQRILWALAGMGLGVCITLCCLVNTANAAAMQMAVIAVSVLVGWIVILLYALVFKPTHAEAEHMNGILKDAQEEHEGWLTVTPNWISIPKSITVRNIRFEEDGNTLTLNVNERLVPQLPVRKSHVRIQTVRKYITGIEVLADET